VEDEQSENFISKSQKKRDMLALQAVGEELYALSVDVLRKLDLPEDLRDALLEAKRISPSKHGGIKRQLQYVGRLMRQVEAEPIIAQLQALKAPSKQQTALHHLAERWRERLLADDSALNAFMNDFPEADRAQLDTHIAESKVEKAGNKPPKHFRLLYQDIHALVVKKAKTESPS
jgi:ribosome-associated protein